MIATAFRAASAAHRASAAIPGSHLESVEFLSVGLLYLSPSGVDLLILGVHDVSCGCSVHCSRARRLRLWHWHWHWPGNLLGFLRFLTRLPWTRDMERLLYDDDFLLARGFVLGSGRPALLLFLGFSFCNRLLDFWSSLRFLEFAPLLLELSPRMLELSPPFLNNATFLTRSMSL